MIHVTRFDDVVTITANRQEAEELRRHLEISAYRREIFDAAFGEAEVEEERASVGAELAEKLAGRVPQPEDDPAKWTLAAMRLWSAQEASASDLPPAGAPLILFKALGLTAAQMNAAAAMIRRVDEIAEPCTGIAAVWCPRCGDCACTRDEDDLEVDSADCPLHAPGSLHGEEVDR